MAVLSTVGPNLSFLGIWALIDRVEDNYIFRVSVKGILVIALINSGPTKGARTIIIF